MKAQEIISRIKMSMIKTGSILTAQSTFFFTDTIKSEKFQTEEKEKELGKLSLNVKRMPMEKSEVRTSKREPDPPSRMKFPDWRKDEEEEEIEKKP
jgi:hypothetical protein